MDVELAATHEAGHAVMQWLVGWEVIELLMTVRDANASQVSARCPCPGVETTSGLRKRLLMLFAGNQVTLARWADKWNDWGDWQDALKALGQHFQRPINWLVRDGKKLQDAEADGALQASIKKCEEIVADLRFRAAVTQIAAEFAGVAPDASDVVRLGGSRAVEICEAAIGHEFRIANPWSAWIAGE